MIIIICGQTAADKPLLAIDAQQTPSLPPFESPSKTPCPIHLPIHLSCPAQLRRLSPPRPAADSALASVTVPDGQGLDPGCRPGW
jgi:hypothetical protein